MKRRKDLLALTYTDLRFRVAAHLLFWGLMFAGNYHFNSISFNAVSGTPAAWQFALKNTLVPALAFYLLVYGIKPLFGRGKAWWAGIVLFLLWLVLIALLDSWGEQQIYAHCPACAERLAQISPSYHQYLQSGIVNIVLSRVLSGGFLYAQVFVLSFPVAIKLARDYFRQTMRQLQLAKDNLQLEFNFLKAQVNPHFLFNTLNNIYSLIMSDRKEQAAATVAQLSGFMRYTLYETGAEQIPLQKEVQLLQDYVALEKLRLNDTQVQFDYQTDREDYTVPPLLFMPALENAFKYGADAAGSAIAVNIEARGQWLQVVIRNQVATGRNTGAGGIGLQNLQKRLRHYYGTAARYSASSANGVYLFELTCPLV